MEARRIRATAESDYRSRIDESELMKKGHEEAASVVEEAQQKAQRMLDIADSDAKTRRASSDQYAQDVLYQLEQQVAGILSTASR